MGASLKTDGSSRKNVLVSSCIFMGLGHIIYLKQYIKGVLFAIIEVIMLCASPKLAQMIKDMIEISRWYPKIRPATFRLVDGIMALAVIAVFVIAYIISVRSA